MSVSKAKLRLIESEEPLDRELVKQTVDGDHGAYAILVERYQRKIFRVAYAIVRDEVEADTVTQDTFVTAYTNLSRFEGRSELETWLTRIAINKSRDVLRARKRRFVPFAADGDGTGVPEPADDRPDAERNLMSTQLAVAIDRALDGLSSQQKAIFRLRHLEDYSLEDIARLMALRPGTVRAHLFRAIHKVRDQLGDWMATPRSMEESK
jgi:RNA polymerase sigma-70 factor (ECF subfamily)